MTPLERLEALHGWLMGDGLAWLVGVAWLAAGVLVWRDYLRARRVLSDPPARVVDAPQGAPTGAPLPPGKDTAP